MSKAIIVPIDGSIPSLQALRFAIETANAFGDSLILLNVQPNLEEYHIKSLVQEKVLSKHQQQVGQDVFKEAIAILENSNTPYETKIRIGIPAIEITEEAKEQHARSIIMGSRGVGPVLAKALGSVSYSVLHLAKCPVTLVTEGTVPSL